MTPYERGFMEKCAELAKRAGGWEAMKNFLAGTYRGPRDLLKTMKARRELLAALQEGPVGSHELLNLARGARSKIGRHPLSMLQEMELLDELAEIGADPARAAERIFNTGVPTSSLLGERVGRIGVLAAPAGAVGLKTLREDDEA